MTTLRTRTRTGVWQFVRHYLEMVVAMVLGMVLLGPLESALLNPLGWAAVRGVPQLEALIMASNMTVAMVVWMRHRGHGWATTNEMAAAMYLPFLVLFPLLWLGPDHPGHHARRRSPADAGGDGRRDGAAPRRVPPATTTEIVPDRATAVEESALATESPPAQNATVTRSSAPRPTEPGSSGLALPDRPVKPELGFHTRFVTPGNYRLWAQSRLADGRRSRRPVHRHHPEMKGTTRTPTLPLDGRVALVAEDPLRRIAIGAASPGGWSLTGRRSSCTPGPRTTRSSRGAPMPAARRPLVAEIRDAGGRAEQVAADLADPDAPARLVTVARTAFGHLDILVANHARSSAQTLEQLTADELDLSHAVNTRATLLLAQAFTAQHDGRRGGRILLFTSGQYHGAMPEELPYIASKGALHQVTRSVAAHLMPRGITVNCIDPGPNDTGYADAATRAAVAAANPGRRWGTPTDTARLLAWLTSDEADWITGQVIASDGGWSAR